MGKKHRYFNMGVFVLVFAMVLAGCSSPSATKDESSDVATAGGAEDGNSLKLLIPNYYNDVEREQWAAVVEKFEEVNPEIEVELETGDVRVESGSLTSLLQSGVNTPDAILMNSGPSRISVLSEASLIMPLDEMYETNQWDQAIRPFAYNMIAGAESIYEVPHMVDAIGYFYNKDVFEEVGVEVPTTEDEFISTVEAIKDTGIAPFTIGARNGYAIGWLFGIMLESIAGTEKAEELFYGKGKWTDPEVVKTAEMMKSWVDDGYISKDAVTLTEADSKFNFLNKQSSMYPGGTYLITDLADQNLQDSVGYFMMPSFVEGEESEPTGGIGQSWVVPTNAPNASATESWLQFILSKDYVETVYSSPDYNFVLASTASTEVEPAGEVLKQASESLEKATGYNPSVFIGVEAKEAYFQNLQGLVGDLVTPEDAMKNIEIGADKDREDGYKLEKAE